MITDLEEVRRQLRFEIENTGDIDLLTAALATLKTPMLSVLIPEHLELSPQFLQAWQAWQKYRRKRSKIVNTAALFARQLGWLEQFDAATATEILRTSMRNGWTGLFPPRGNGQVRDKKIDYTKGF